VRSGTHTYQPFESDFLSNFTLPRHSIQRNFYCSAELSSIIIKQTTDVNNFTSSGLFFALRGYNSHPRQISYSFMMIRGELQQLMHTKCHKTDILALAPTPCSKCMVRV
jgi:hypothetical protein